MEKLVLSKISPADLNRFVTLLESGITAYPWVRQSDSVVLTENDLRQLEDIKNRLLNYSTHLMNEATIWSRGIYPLLALAEQEAIQAWAQVPLQARYAQFEIEGVADGVLGKTVAGHIAAPYLVVAEAKRGIEGQNPLFQLYGYILASVRINWEEKKEAFQEIFGCYTIADSWTFVRAEVEDIESDLPVLRVEYSREYAEKTEAETILKILRLIIARYLEK